MYVLTCLYYVAVLSESTAIALCLVLKDSLTVEEAIDASLI